MMNLFNKKLWAVVLPLVLLAPARVVADPIVRALDMSLARGQTNRLLIVLQADGGENALGFSLCYDTNLLAFVKAVRGREATNANATLNVNSNQAVSMGRVGFALALTSGQAFPTGSNTIVEVLFRAASGTTATVTPVTVCNLPIGLEVVDVDAGTPSATTSDATVTILGTPCSYSLGTSSVSVGAEGRTNAVAVSTTTGCSWTVVNTNDWIRITSATSGTGNGNVSYAVAANSNALARTAVVVIAGQTFTINQAGATCTYTIAPTNQTHTSDSVTGSVNVITFNGCSWTTINTNSWITITSGATGTGGGTVTYTTAANPSFSPRSGVVTIAGRNFALTQLGMPCAYKLSTTNRTHGNGAATNSVSLTASNECAWTIINTNDWIAITSSTSGSGSAIVAYTVQANLLPDDRIGVILMGGQSFTLTQHGITCSYSLSPTNRSHGYGAATNSLNVSTSTGCNWTVSNSNDWITLVSGTNGSGNGTVTYTVTANPNATGRTGIVTVATQLFTVSQSAAPCSYSISSSLGSHGVGSETGLVTVTAVGGCSWTASTTNSWITIVSGTTGTGNGTVRYVVESNSSTVGRTGFLTIAGSTFTVAQAGIGVCSYKLSTTSRTHGSGAASNAVTITTSNYCSWTVVNTNEWIAIISSTSGTGNGTVSYTVMSNPSPMERTGLVTIADQVLTLVQHAASCTFSISPTNRMHGYAMVTNSVSLTTISGCPWSVVNTNDWITILGDTNGTASSAVTYVLSANQNPFQRTGLVTIGDQLFSVTQRAAPCLYELSPTNRLHGHSAETGMVSVMTTTNCAWTASNTNDWITITSGADGMGNGTVTYAVAANPRAIMRTGVVLIGGETFTVMQRPVPCTYTISPTNGMHGPPLETGMVSVTTITGCSWTVINTNDWITILSGTDGSNSASVFYTVAPNPSLNLRTGVLTIGDQLYTVIQAGFTCSYKLSPTNRVHGYGSSTGIVSVTTSNGCDWSVANTNNWITIASGTTGSGSGSVGYLIDANPMPSDRAGVVLIAGQSFTLTQRAAPCTISISPTSRTHGYGMATGTVTVTTLSGCQWAVSNANDWITLSATNGVGPLALTYVVAVNPNGMERTGVVMIADQSLTLIQRAAPCTVAISPSARTHGYSGATGTVSVTTAIGCSWSVANTNDWITILSGTSDTSSGTITYVVSTNPHTIERTGIVMIGDQLLTLSQRAAPCTFTLSPSNRVHSYGAETGVVNVTTSSNCPWTAGTTNDWIIITSGASGLGNGTAGYSLDPNPSPIPRTGALTIGQETFLVAQSGIPCTYSISAPEAVHGAGLETGLVSVMTSNWCPWSVVCTNDWISVPSGTNGFGPGGVSYKVGANPSLSPRTGVLIIAGIPFTVNQEGATCTYKFSPTNRVHGYGMATGTVSVTSISGCSWSVAKTNDWITIISSTTGTGSGSVTYSLAANPSLVERTGALTIADQTVMLTQRAAPCTFSISPANRVHGYGGATGTVSLTTISGCAWEIVNTNNWITILSSLSGSASGSITYTVDPNPITIARTGAVMIGDQVLTLSQRAAPCLYALAPFNAAHGYGSETGLVNVTTISNCSWNVLNTNDWIVITSGANGLGAGSIGYRVSPNKSHLDRTGTVTVGDEAFEVRQAGSPCVFTVSPTNQVHGSGMETGLVDVATINGCSWEVINTNEWIVITSSNSVNGSGSVSYLVAANPGVAARTATISIAGQDFVVSQAGAPCTYVLSPTNASVEFGGGSGRVNVTTPIGCPWIVFNSNSWITITSETTGTSNGSVSYTVLSNATRLPRRGIVGIAGQAFTVIQNPVPEAVKPSVRITLPVLNSSTTNFMISGTAQDNVGIAAVKIQAGNGEFLTANGTTAWSINLAGRLIPGTNVIRVKSLDYTGNESVVITQRFFFIPTSPLTVRTSGYGIVTPNQNGRPLEVGRSYTIVAAPSAGYVFSNWTGGLSASTSRLTFVMQSNLVLQANFVPNPFRLVKGIYNGLFYTDEADHRSSGFITVTLAEPGTFTATMLTGGRRLVFSGAFNLLGLATNTVPRPGTSALTVELMLDSSPGGTTITGQVRDGTFEARLTADRSVFHPVSNPATNFAGKYTLIVPGNTNPAAGPEGDGFGTVSVDLGGNVTFTGTLSDGTPATQRVPLSKSGDWPLYVSLYSGKGSLLSGITFTNQPGDDLSGECRWIKPTSPLTKYYPGGFANKSTLTGSRYTAPGTNKVINVTDGLATFTGGNLDVPFTNRVTIGLGNKITNLDSNKLTLTFTLPTGLFNGVATIPGTNKTVTFKGTVHQKQRRASGFFLGTNQSGRVNLE